MFSRFKKVLWFASSVVQSIADLSRSDLLDPRLNVLDRKTTNTISFLLGEKEILTVESEIFLMGAEI